MSEFEVIKRTKDGFLLAHSPDLPGFNLCVPANADLAGQLGPAVAWFVNASKDFPALRKHRA